MHKQLSLLLPLAAAPLPQSVSPACVVERTFMHVDQCIQQIDEIAKIIQCIPKGRRTLIDLPENGATHHEDDVVQHGQGDHSEPL